MWEPPLCGDECGAHLGNRGTKAPPTLLFSLLSYFPDSFCLLNGCAVPIGRRLFGMQVYRTRLRRVAVEPREESHAARTPTPEDVADERLGFHDGDVRFAGDREEIVRDIAANRPGRSPVKRDRDLVHRFAVEMQRSHPATDKRARLDRAAQGDNADEIRVLDS